MNDWAPCSSYSSCLFTHVNSYTLFGVLLYLSLSPKLGERGAWRYGWLHPKGVSCFQTWGSFSQSPPIFSLLWYPIRDWGRDPLHMPPCVGFCPCSSVFIYPSGNPHKHLVSQAVLMCLEGEGLWSFVYLRVLVRAFSDTGIFSYILSCFDTTVLMLCTNQLCLCSCKELRINSRGNIYTLQAVWPIPLHHWKIFVCVK